MHILFFVKDNFKSLDENKEKEKDENKKEEDKEFEEQRRATIKAAVISKAEVSGKFLGPNSKVLFIHHSYPYKSFY